MPAYTFPGGVGTEVQYRSGVDFAAVTGSSFDGSILTLTTVVLAGATVVNEAGGDFDFRLEGDTDTTLIYADAGLDKVGIGKQPTTDSGKLHVKAQDANKSVLTLSGATAQASFYLEVLNASDTGLFWIDNAGSLLVANSVGFKFKSAAGTPATVMQIDGGNTWIATNPFDSNSVFGTAAAGTGSCYLQTQGQNRIQIDSDGVVNLTRGTTAGELRLLEPSGSGVNYVSMVSPARAANLNLIFPSGLPTVNQVLEASAVSGSDVTLGWVTAGSGSVATDAIWDVKGDLAVGTGANTASRLAVGTNGYVLSADSAEATGLKWIALGGGGDMVLASSQVVTGLKTFGSAGAVGKFALAGTTSGSTVVDASAVASGTITIPAATDTLVGKATTDTLTNKTYDTAGTGNSFSINGVAVTANTGTGSVVRQTSPSITTDITIPNTGLHLLDTNASHDLIIAPGSDLTADHTLTITTGDADRTLTINASTTLGGGTHSGTNTGDQTITLTGNVTGSGTGSFSTTIASGAVTLAMMANLAQDQFIGRVTASTGVPETATITSAARTVLDDTSTSAMLTTLGGQPVDATLTAFAALTIAADSLTIGTGADAFSQTTFAANTFPAKASTGNLVAKTITDAALTVLDDTTVGAMLSTLGGQPLDATLTAFAALTIAAESLTIGTGADAFTQVTFAANTFPARASTGSLVAKTITDAALTVLDDTTVSAMVDTLGGASSTGTGGLVRSAGPTLTGKTKTTSAYQDIVTDSVVSTTVTFDLSAGNVHQITLTASGWTFALSNATTGQVFSIRVLQDGTGSRTIGSWFTTIRWAGGSAPTLTTTLNKWDWFGFVCTGTNTYDGFVLGQNG